MSLGLRAAVVAAIGLCAIAGAPAIAAEFTDSAGRIVPIPDHVSRVMPANTTAEALIYVLAPKKLAGWTRPVSAGGLPRHARVPQIGELSGPNPTASAATVTRLHPDLIIDSGKVTPERAAFADQISQATGVPYILIDNSIDRTPTMLRTVGRVLGVGERGDDLAGSAEHAINALRGRLLIQPPTQRPRVYYARGPLGLETGLSGSSADAAIEAAGAINVAASLGTGERAAVTPQQIRDWNPDVIIAEDRAFYAAAQRNRAWSGLVALRGKKLFLEPSSPFGWIDDPPGVNRLIGFYWLAQVLYPGHEEEDLRTLMADLYDKFYGIKLTDAQIEGIAKTAGIPPSETPHLATLPSLGTAPGGSTGVPGAVNEPGRRGILPSQPPVTTTPSYMLPK